MTTFIGILIPLIIVIISSYIIWRGTDLFDGAASYLGRNLTEGIKGATINAIGSSMPEFLSTLIFLFYLDNSEGLSGGIGITAGSAIFNLLVIPIAILFTLKMKKMSTDILLDRYIIKRDGISLLAINLLLIVILTKNAIHWYHGLILILSYFVYLAVIWKDLKRSRENGRTYVDEKEYQMENESKRVDNALALDLISVLKPSRATNKRNAIIYLFYTVLVVSVGTWLLVYAIEKMGSGSYSFMELNLKGINLPTIFVSLILGAAASSVPDTILSIKDAVKGNHKDAISNCIGSNIFDISFALGLPILIYTLFKGDAILLSPMLKSLNVQLWLLLFVINLITIVTIVIRGKIDYKVGRMMTAIYIMFIGYVIFVSITGHFDNFV